LAGFVVVAVASTHPFSVHDMLAMQRIGDPQLSPDGKRIVFTLRSTDFEANRGRTDLWMIGVNGKGARQLTSHEAGESNPRWAPDGRSVWFVSSRSGSSQLWRIAVDGGEARQVTELPLDVTSFAVSRDGSKLALSLEVFPDCPTIECTTQRLDEHAAREHSARVYERLFVRHWDTWKDGRRSHLFVMPAEGGDVVDVMAGMDADCPSKPFGGPEEYTFSPDGSAVVFSARDAGAAEAWSTDFDLYRADVRGGVAPVNLTDDNEAWDTQPVFSPDGTTLAYLAMRVPGYEADRFRIVLRAWPDGKPREPAGEWDRSPRTLAWARDGKRLLATADDLGQRSLFAVDTASGEVETLASAGTVRWMAETSQGVVFSRDDLRSAVELFRLGTEGQIRPVTEFNTERLASTRMGQPEQFTFPGWKGETVHAYVVKPADFDGTKTYPVAFLIHGGPQGSFGNDFHYRWNPQAYAGAGYAAVMVDFHGSTGYGQQFTDSIGGDWGGKPLVDLQKGLAAALERYPWMDGERVCALGASFGGYMVNWIEGNWPDRFRCLVNHDGNLDERLAYFDTEELWFPERDHQGTPWDVPQNYEAHNPVNHVAKWKTPMLVIHGALDYRVVDTQGLSTFTALQRRGIPSKLVYFPDENHWVLKPHNSVFWHETVLEWLDRWTAKE
jgi:dipeptidyl aminopeptidase/acylaminoacyl peptidase